MVLNKCNQLLNFTVHEYPCSCWSCWSAALPSHQITPERSLAILFPCTRPLGSALCIISCCRARLHRLWRGILHVVRRRILLHLRQPCVLPLPFCSCLADIPISTDTTACISIFPDFSALQASFVRTRPRTRCSPWPGTGSGVNCMRSAATSCREACASGSAGGVVPFVGALRGVRRGGFLRGVGVRMRLRARRWPASSGPGLSDAMGSITDAIASAMPSLDSSCRESLSGCAAINRSVNRPDRHPCDHQISLNGITLP